MAFTRIGDVKLTLQQLSNRAAWVKALLSGDYQQSLRHLRTSTGWCCLGVAADVISSSERDRLITINGTSLLPDLWAKDHLGLSGDFISQSNEQLAATGWNDRDGLSFEQIADRIALATARKVTLRAVQDARPELDGEEPGAFASEWLSQNV